MPIEIKWDDTDPESGGRRFLRAAKFAGEWQFSYRLRRRDVRWLRMEPTRDMWEHVLDSLKRRYRRREGVSDADVDQVERVLRNLRDTSDEEE
jgi:hypothetical protein